MEIFEWLCLKQNFVLVKDYVTRCFLCVYFKLETLLKIAAAMTEQAPVNLHITFFFFFFLLKLLIA